VSDRALVRLIAGDGFQIQHGGRTYPCDVGVLTHQPPEFQGVASFRGLKRTVNHDGFGLAVLVFQLLFMARHPFSGSYGKAGDMPLERAIKEFRFVYGAKAPERGMQPPPAAVDLTSVTRDVARLFEQAFSPAGAKGERPSALQWAVALEELGRLVQRCRTNPCHAYLKGRSCPFCAIDRQTDRALFHLPVLQSSGRPNPVAVHLPNPWKRSARSRPGAAPELLVPLGSRASVHGRRAQALDPHRGPRRDGAHGPRPRMADRRLSLALPSRPGRERGTSAAVGGSALPAGRAAHAAYEQAPSVSSRSAPAELRRAATELEGLDEEHAKAPAEPTPSAASTSSTPRSSAAHVTAELWPSTAPPRPCLVSYGIETADEVRPRRLAHQMLSEAARRRCSRGARSTSRLRSTRARRRPEGPGEPGAPDQKCRADLSRS
jgi:hypothetical protein